MGESIASVQTSVGCFDLLLKRAACGSWARAAQILTFWARELGSRGERTQWAVKPHPIIVAFLRGAIERFTVPQSTSGNQDDGPPIFVTSQIVLAR